MSKIIGSSYACRNVYNLTNGNLSQHAFANAVDLPMFVLADGRKIDVTHGWGSTQRDLIAVARAKKTAAGVTGAVGQQKKDKSIKGSVIDVMKISAVPSGTTSANQSAASGVAPQAVAEAKFLRVAHDGGCKYSRRSWDPRPTKSIGPTCIWTSRTERRRSANKPCTTSLC